MGYGVERGQDKENYAEYGNLLQVQSESSEPLYDDGPEWTAKSFFSPSSLGLSIREDMWLEGGCQWRGFKISALQVTGTFTGMVCRIQYAKTRIQPSNEMLIRLINR